MSIAINTSASSGPAGVQGPVLHDVHSPRSRSYRGQSMAARQAERRERLMAAALDEFGEMGVRDATMRAISARARLQDKYFRENFDSLESLFLAVHRQLSKEVGRRMTIRSFEAGGPARLSDAFAASLHEFFHYIKEDPRRARILVTEAFAQGLLNPTNLDAYVSRYSEILRFRVREIFPGVQGKISAPVVLAGLVGQVMNSALVWVSNGFDLPVEAMVEHSMFGFNGMLNWLATVDAQASAK
jgi:AcrR family transcriptional regulator